MDLFKIVDERQSLHFCCNCWERGIFCLPGLLSCWVVSQECMGPSCRYLLRAGLRERLTQRKYELGNGWNQTPGDIIKHLDPAMPEVILLLYFFSGMSQYLLFLNKLWQLRVFLRANKRNVLAAAKTSPLTSPKGDSPVFTPLDWSSSSHSRSFLL